MRETASGHNSPRTVSALIRGRSNPAIVKLKRLEAEMTLEIADALRAGTEAPKLARSLAEACEACGTDIADLNVSTYPMIAYATGRIDRGELAAETDRAIARLEKRAAS